MRWPSNNNTPFSPESRLEIYTLALRFLEKQSVGRYSICRPISLAESFLYDYYWEFDLNSYPEIAKIQTLRKRFGFTYWWAPTNKEVRIKALQNAIAEVEAIIQQSKTEGHVR